MHKLQSTQCELFVKSGSTILIIIIIIMMWGERGVERDYNGYLYCGVSNYLRGNLDLFSNCYICRVRYPSG